MTISPAKGEIREWKSSLRYSNPFKKLNLSLSLHGEQRQPTNCNISKYSEESEMRRGDWKSAEFTKTESTPRGNVAFS